MSVAIPLKLATDIVDELMNPEFLSRTHGTRSCSNAGCGGPLCQKFNRDHQRKIYRSARPTPTRIRRGPKDPEIDDYLLEIIKMHKENRGYDRAA